MSIKNDNLDDEPILERVESFGGGEDSFQRSTLLQPDQSQKLLNVIARDNLEARTRPGADALKSVDNVIYQNTEQTVTVNCIAPSIGDSVTVTVPAGTEECISQLSQSDADAKAESLARSRANAQLVCHIEPPVNLCGVSDNAYGSNGQTYDKTFNVDYTATGHLQLNFQPFNIPDRVQVIAYDADNLAYYALDTGMVGYGNGPFSFPILIPPGTKKVRIVITPGGTTSAWSYSIECSDSCSETVVLIVSGAAASSTADGSAAANAFDLNDNTYWRSGSEITTAWLRATLAANKTASQYIVASKTGNNSPKSWTLQGDQNDDNWITLDTRSNETGWQAGISRRYQIASPGSYRRYRLNITAINLDSIGNTIGYSQYIFVSEFQLLQCATGSACGIGDCTIAQLMAAVQERYRQGKGLAVGVNGDVGDFLAWPDKVVSSVNIPTPNYPASDWYDDDDTYATDARKAALLQYASDGINTLKSNYSPLNNFAGFDPVATLGNNVTRFNDTSMPPVTVTAGTWEEDLGTLRGYVCELENIVVNISYGAGNAYSGSAPYDAYATCSDLIATIAAAWSYNAPIAASFPSAVGNGTYRPDSTLGNGTYTSNYTTVGLAVAGFTAGKGLISLFAACTVGGGTGGSVNYEDVAPVDRFDGKFALTAFSLVPNGVDAVSGYYGTQTFPGSTICSRPNIDTEEGWFMVGGAILVRKRARPSLEEWVYYA